MRVMVLDSNELARSMLNCMLAREGHEVVMYSDPSGCPLFTFPSCPCGMNGHCPDAIMADLHMPTASGLAFVDEQRRKGCRCRFVALMAGSWEDDELVRAAQLGVTLFSKPFHFEKLRRWLAEAQSHAERVGATVPVGAVSQAAAPA